MGNITVTIAGASHEAGERELARARVVVVRVVLHRDGRGHVGVGTPIDRAERLAGDHAVAIRAGSGGELCRIVRVSDGVGLARDALQVELVPHLQRAVAIDLVVADDVRGCLLYTSRCV